MSHRPLTRSQTAKHLRSGATKREAASNDTHPAPKRKQQRRHKKTEDAVAVVDQSALEEHLQRDLKEECLLEYAEAVKVKEKDGHEVLVWGDGSMGQLGMGEDEDGDPLKTLPAVLSLEKKVVQVAVGGMHTLMLMTDGSLQSFGSNDEGALGRKTVGDVWDIDEDPNESMKQSAPGEVILLGEGVQIKGVSCTDSASFTWTTDGGIYGWGSFRSSSGLVGFSDDVQIQKTPTCIYRPASPQKETVKLATGGHHVLALLKDGSVLSWGDGERGQLGRCHPENDTKSAMLRPTVITAIEGQQVVDVFCGESTSFFKTASGTILACGLNNSGQLGITPSEDLAEDQCPTIESSVKGKALFLKPTEVQSLSNLKLDVKQIASGKRHTLVLTANGAVYSFGSPMYGVLGRLENESDILSAKLFPIPQKLSGLENRRIECIAAGQDCSACIDSEGNLVRFGGEHSGLICVGWDGEDILLPQVLTKGTATKRFKFTCVEFGGQHGILLGQKRQ